MGMNMQQRLEENYTFDLTWTILKRFSDRKNEIWAQANWSRIILYKPEGYGLFHTSFFNHRKNLSILSGSVSRKFKEIKEIFLTGL